MRLFIAINFSEPSRRALLEARERLRGLTGGRGGFTQDTNLHLTLAFLGEVEQERAKAAEEAMRAAQGRALTLVHRPRGALRARGRRHLVGRFVLRARARGVSAPSGARTHTARLRAGKAPLLPAHHARAACPKRAAARHAPARETRHRARGSRKPDAQRARTRRAQVHGTGPC